MKVLIRIFLPLCILSFIAFGISTAVLGVNPDVSYSELSGTSGEISTTTLEGEFDSIDIDSGASKVTVKSHSEDYVRVTVEGQNYAKVNAKISGGTLKVYNEWNGSWDWLNRLFTGELFNSAAAKITVLVPERVYENLDIYCSSGTVVCDGIKALDVNLKLSSGAVKYKQPDMFTAESIDIKVSSGQMNAYNVQTLEYDIGVSSGNVYVGGLSGSGDISVSSGSVNASFVQLNGNCGIDVSSGDVNVYIPDNASADIQCSRSSGKIRVAAFGVDKFAADGETIQLNGGDYNIDVDVSSGSVSVVDGEMAASANDIVIDTNGGIVTTATGIAEVAPVEAVGDEVQSAVEQAMADVSEALGNL